MAVALTGISWRALFGFNLDVERRRCAGKRSTENIVVDNDDIQVEQRNSSWSIPSTSRLRCDIQLSKLRVSSRSASDIHQLPDRDSIQHSAADMSLRLSGCGAERSIKAKRRVIKVTLRTYLLTGKSIHLNVYCNNNHLWRPALPTVGLG